MSTVGVREGGRYGFSLRWYLVGGAIVYAGSLGVLSKRIADGVKRGTEAV
ncbi:hypothetical protein [Salarchaeum sp. JOR-1]|nr:hypothetical protein [Salarchaeum sp. JOR-1]